MSELRRRSKLPMRVMNHPIRSLPEPKGLRLLVAGEVILDRYVSGEVERISPEAPVPVLKVRKREDRPGNAGFVMCGVRALGAAPVALSVVGADGSGQLLRQKLSALEIDTKSLIVDPSRPTTVKERFLGSVQSADRATQQLLRVDEEEIGPLASATEQSLIERLELELDRADGVLVSDINKGVLTPRLLRALIDRAGNRGTPVFVDPRLTDDFAIYRGATVITPNRFETEKATGIRLDGEAGWHAAAKLLVEQLDLKACLITLDRDGMYLLERDGQGHHVPTTPRDVYDVTGAGDVVLTVFGFFASAGESLLSAAFFANAAAGIEVSLHGAEVISRAALERSLAREDIFERKILPIAELVDAVDRDRMRGRRIAFTNGCFDLLHTGHLQTLSFARSQADVLVVALNSDESVRQLKGPERPVCKAAERARLLAALEIVDYVVVFDGFRAEDTIRSVRPDILVKGEDFLNSTVDGQEFVEAYGGRVVYSPMLDGQSTTRMIERVRNGDTPFPSDPPAAAAR
jgi:D-beta-D-heptose 7-phosphate kinase / D-beta-D-heptose 1-phosphate adenosyltransferase